MGLLTGKTALITGGSRGIGKAIVERYAEEGANVAFTYISPSSGEKALQLAEALNGQGGVIVKAYQSDASSFAQAESLINQVISDFGQIDILINNAGITKDNLLLRMTEEQWDSVMEVNLKSIYNTTKNILKPMMKQRAGSIINITSIVGVTGNAGQSNYSASKAGMIGFTKSIAKEIGSRGIRCNAIAPGFIATEMTGELGEKVIEGYLNNIPLKRFGDAKEIADACVYFGSDMSTYVSGQVLSVCGALNC